MTGYTLPVFAAAAAKAAIAHLFDLEITSTEVQLDLSRGDGIVTLPVESVARLDGNTALAIARSEPGNNLD